LHGDGAGDPDPKGVTRPRAEAERSPVVATRQYSFGSTAAIVTSVGLIVGLDTEAVSRATLVSGLAIIAVADNISDSLSIHVYQESENLEARAALRATLSNFVARLVVAMTFVALVLLVPPPALVPAALAWGFALLAALTYRVARARGARPGREIVKHVLVALAVVGASRGLGAWIAAHVR
jgi:VIT1/CCC1 family predicted Fe2+/Mn2+ transporter